MTHLINENGDETKISTTTGNDPDGIIGFMYKIIIIPKQIYGEGKTTCLKYLRDYIYFLIFRPFAVYIKTLLKRSFDSERF